MSAEQAFAVHECIDDIALLVNERAVQVEDLVEVGVQHVAQRKCRDDDRDRNERRNRDMQRLFPPGRPVDFRRFVQRGIDTRQSGQEDDRIEAELFPDVADDDREAEPVAVAQEEDRFRSEQVDDKLIDESGLREHIDQNAGQRHPRKKVRQINESLNRPFQCHFPDFVQQQGKDERHDQVHDNFGTGEKERIARDFEEIFILPHVLEMLQAYPGRLGKSERRLVILKSHYDTAHGNIRKNKDHNGCRKHHEMQNQWLFTASFSFAAERFCLFCPPACLRFHCFPPLPNVWCVSTFSAIYK